MNKKLLFFISIMTFTCISHLFSQEVNVLVIMSRYFGLNYNFNMDCMDEFGWNVTHTAVTKTVVPCPGASQIASQKPIDVDTLISEINDVTKFDVVAIMPTSWRYTSNPYQDLLDSPEAINLIKTAADSGLVIWATCVGPRVLAKADILQGKKITGQSVYQSEYEAAGAIFLGEGLRPVIDGTIITTVRGQYYSKENIEAIATAVELTRKNRAQKGGVK